MDGSANSIVDIFDRVNLTEWKAPEENDARLLTMPNVPLPLHALAPRNIVGPTEWNKIRKRCYVNANWKCEICGKELNPGEAQAHEVYSYDYKKQEAVFERPVCVCKTCVDEDTEVLTSTGWKKIPEVTKRDMVANYNKEDDSISFSHPIETIKTNPSKAVKISGYGAELFFSEDHRLPLKVASKQSPSYGRVVDILAKDYTPSHYYNWINNGYNNKKETLTYEERVYIAIEADGCMTWDKDRPRGHDRVRAYNSRYDSEEYRYTYTIHLCKTRKINRMKYLLEKSGMKYKITKETSDSYCDFNIWSNKDLKTFSNCFDINMGKEKALEFIEELVFWDGTYSGAVTTWYTNKPEEADFVQAIAAQCGVLANINVVNRIGNIRKGQWKTPYERLTYSVNFQSVHNKWGGKTMTREDIPWDKPMYCLSVKSTYFVARRDKKVFITGNCHVLGIHSGRALSMYKKKDKYTTKRILLEGAENLFRQLHEWNLEHPEEEPLRAYSTFIDYWREIELRKEMERIFNKYDAKFYQVKDKWWGNSKWKNWHLVFNGGEYPTQFDSREDWKKKMEAKLQADRAKSKARKDKENSKLKEVWKKMGID